MLVEIRDDGRGFDPARAIPATSASSRCAAAPPRSAAQLTITSVLGRGTVVRVEAPAAVDALRMAADPNGPIRVLVVDDHAVVRRGLLAFLESEPDLEVVGDAAGGPRRSTCSVGSTPRAGGPTWCVMDLQMRPLDGIESTRLIRARYADVEVVVLTSFADEERVRAALEAGASGYLLKDADADEVAAAIRAAHRGELQLDPAVARRLLSSLRAAPYREATVQLTARELEVLRLVGAGRANKEIAAQLDISERTARTHVSNILRKLGLSSRTQAALWAVREGLVEGVEH